MPISRSIKILGVLVALPGVGIGILFASSPLLERLVQKNIPKIERAASEFFGSQVKFKSIEAKLDWLRPEFAILDLGVSTEQPSTKHPGFSVQKLTLQLDLVQSVLTFTPKFGKILLSGANFKIEEIQNNAENTGWILSGLPQKQVGDSSSGTNIPEWISPKFSISITESKVQIVPLDRLKNQLTEVALKNANSTIELSPLDRSVRAQVQMAGFTVSSPSLWFRPSHWESLTLKAQWLPSQQELQVDQFMFSVENLRVKGKLNFRAADGYLGVLSELEDSDLTAFKRMIPLPLLSQSVKLWLDTSLQGGVVKSGKFTLFGFPQEWKAFSAFDGKRNHLDLQLAVEGLKLDYLEDWPTLTQGKGTLGLQDKTLAIDMASAEASPLKVTQLSARIEDLTQDHLALTLGLQLKAPPENVVEFLKTGPFKADSALLLGLAYPTGPLETALNLEIPLSESDQESGLKGSAEIRTAALRILDRLDRKNWELDLKNLQGQVEFTQTEIQSTGLQAQLFGKKSRISLKHTRDSNGPIQTHAELDSITPVDRLRVMAPEYPLEKVFLGEVPSKLAVDINHGKTSATTNIGIQWKSDLLSTEILAPAPLGKKPGEPLSSLLSASFQGESLEKLHAQVDKEGAQALHVGFDFIKSKISATGDLQRLQLDAWRDWWTNINYTPEKNSRTTPSMDFQLKAKSAKWKNFEIQNAELQVEKKSENWFAKLRSNEAIGDVEYSSGQEPGKVTAKFKQLIFPQFPWNKTEDNPAAAPSSQPPQPAWDLKSWPSLSLRCARLQVEGKELGNLSVEVKQTGESLTLKEFSLLGPELGLKISKGEADYASAAPFTSLEGSLDLIQTVPPFRFKSMSSALLSNGNIKFKAEWPGGPERFGFAKVNAEIEGHIKSGKLTGVKSGVQSVFNFFSMSWSDARNQIMRFTKMFFQIQIKDGQILTRVGRALFGSIYVKTSGSITVESSAVKMEAQVTPGVEEIGDDPSQEIEEAHNLLSHTYNITGTWTEPRTALKVF